MIAPHRPAYFGRFFDAFLNGLQAGVLIIVYENSSEIQMKDDMTLVIAPSDECDETRFATPGRL